MRKKFVIYSKRWYIETFKKVFPNIHQHPLNFVDRHVMMFSDRPKFVVDIILLDHKLHELYGSYERNNQSAKDLVLEKYGEEACDFIEISLKCYESPHNDHKTSNQKLSIP